MMADISAGELPSGDVDASLDLVTVQALNVHAVQATMAAAWGDVVESLSPLVKVDKKGLLAHRRAFLDPRAYQLLQIIWIESPYVSDAELATADLGRNFSDCSLNCHSLAVASCLAPNEVDKTEKRVQKVIAAAEVFGLVEKEIHTAKKHPLRGTQLLHQTMMAMGKANVTVIAERFGVLTEGTCA